MSMKIALSLRRKTLLVRLDGELDHHSSADIRDMVERAVTEQDVRNLIFDFSKLSFMDSSAIGMVIGRYKLMNALGGQVVLVCSDARMNKLIKMSGLTKLIKVYHDVDSDGDLFRDAQIAGDRKDSQTLRGGLFRQRGEPFGINIHSGDVGTLPGEGEGGGTAKSATGTGYNGDFSGKIKGIVHGDTSQ